MKITQLTQCHVTHSNNNNPHSHNLLPIRHENRPTIQNPSPIFRSTMILTSWLNRRHFRRYFLCSPFLLPLFASDRRGNQRRDLTAEAAMGGDDVRERKVV
ncbi:hypothetical protein H5410_017570 [Solanum commersonii]|uniref:Uncharacterized protein n=1 Tax=Solanum commersonii TaxID=4109 RepID=A0A9J6A0E3_SOLCO|nr:hypothetical protein H5410_017570 [Solanum commersonii]